MKTQNYSNHKKFVAGYHYIAFSLLLILFVMSVYNVYISFKNYYDMRVSVMFLVTCVFLILLFFYCRLFALKAQDRAIRAEENFRFYVLTGKIPDSKLNIDQVVALRFAPDDELVGLYVKAIEHGMSSDEIKRNINNWKSDFNRV